MKIKEFYDYMCEKIPASLTLAGDYDGMSCCPNPEREVTKVMIALDVNESVIDEAAEEGCEVILAHHPMLYGGLKEVTAGSVKGDRLIKLIKNDIAVMSFHTRLDAVCGGVNDCLAALVGLENTESFGENGICRIGDLPYAVTPEMLACTVRDALGAPHVDYSDSEKLIKRVAVCGGSAGSFIREAAEAGADALVCGEIGYHAQADGPESGLCIITAGHFYTENPVCGRLFEYCVDADITAVITSSNKIGSV